MEQTSIRLSIKNRDRLRKMESYPKETFDSIIERLIKNKKRKKVKKEFKARKKNE